jgi:hypothetical protein
MRRWLRGEPTLSGVFADPVIQLIMRRDRVDPDNLHAMLRGVSARLPSLEPQSDGRDRRPTKTTGM